MSKKGIYFYEFAGKLVVLWECGNVKEQANFLRELRMRKGLKQKDVASALGFSIQLISAWEKGGSFPDAFSWKKILDLYGISLSSLLYEDLSLASTKTDMEFRPEEFAARLERLRKKKGLTQVELSAELGIN
ncbi:MAG: XRE family transcriptional regulator, partial [Bacilli bacterium]|nr:XRE family transcriptional regulator [Bacilli bacterium]